MRLEQRRDEVVEVVREVVEMIVRAGCIWVTDVEAVAARRCVGERGAFRAALGRRVLLTPELRGVVDERHLAETRRQARQRRRDATVARARVLPREPGFKVQVRPPVDPLHELRECSDHERARERHSSLKRRCYRYRRCSEGVSLSSSYSPFVG